MIYCDGNNQIVIRFMCIYYHLVISMYLKVLFWEFLFFHVINLLIYIIYLSHFI
jgi:hypothetical protein